MDNLIASIRKENPSLRYLTELISDNYEQKQDVHQQINILQCSRFIVINQPLPRFKEAEIERLTFQIDNLKIEREKYNNGIRAGEFLAGELYGKQYV